MKRYIFSLVCALFSITGISQETMTIPVSESDLSQPFLNKCESLLDWENQNNGGYDCILSADYYVKEFSILPGLLLDSISFKANFLNVDDPEGDELLYRGTYDDWTQYNGEPIETLQLMGGVYIKNTETNEIVYYIDRYGLANTLSLSEDSTFFANELNIPSGNYEIMVVNNEGDNLGYGQNTIHIGDFLYLSPPAAEGIIIDFMADGPEIETNEIVLSLYPAPIDLTEFEDRTYEVCSDSPLDVEFACSAVDGIEFMWEVNVPETNLWLDQDSDCTYNFQEPYDTTANNWNVYDTRLIVTYPESYEMDPDISETFQIQVNPNPSWNFEADALTFQFLDPELIFSVVLTDLNYPDNEIDGDYNWAVNDSWEGADLVLEANAGGYSAEFVFNPFVAEEDTIASFFVDATAINGCSTLDTTYVVYIDTDGDGGWSPGDSIDFRSFIIIEDPTSIKEVAKKNIKLYPNPVNDIFTIEQDLTGNVQMNIISMNGQVIRQERITSPMTQVDVADLPKGVYLVTVFNEEGQRTTSQLVKL